MHYKNGREAKLGDPVIGRGYNIKGAISGMVISLHPQQISCNITIQTYEQMPYPGNYQFGTPMRIGHGGVPESFAVPVQESGQCDAFLHVEDAMACCLYNVDKGGVPNLANAVVEPNPHHVT